MVQYQGDRGERIYTFHLFYFFLTPCDVLLLR